MGRDGYAPFGSDDASMWFAGVASKIEAPIERVARLGRQKRAHGARPLGGHAYEEAYAAIWIAIGIERHEPALFHDGHPAITAEAVAQAKNRSKMLKRRPALRVRPATPAFWKLAKKAARVMATDEAFHGDFRRPEAAHAAYAYLYAEVRAIVRRQAMEAAQRKIDDADHATQLAADRALVKRVVAARGARKTAPAIPKAKRPKSNVVKLPRRSDEDVE